MLTQEWALPRTQENHHPGKKCWHKLEYSQLQLTDYCCLFHFTFRATMEGKTHLIFINCTAQITLSAQVKGHRSYIQMHDMELHPTLKRYELVLPLQMFKASLLYGWSQTFQESQFYFWTWGYKNTPGRGKPALSDSLDFYTCISLSSPTTTHHRYPKYARWCVANTQTPIATIVSHCS